MNYRKTKKGFCECIIGQDPASYQPHLIKCGKPASYIYFWRQWFVEIIKESKDPIYSNIGALCCEECFGKIKEEPPADLEHYQQLYLKNKSK